MAKHIDIYVSGENYHFPDKKLQKEFHCKVGEEPSHPAYKAYVMGSGLACLHPRLIKMFQDIQHRLFRLGKLGGLKGDVFQAYSDQIGDATRYARYRMIYGSLCGLRSLFVDDEMNLLHPLKYDVEKVDDGLWAINDNVFIDMDDSVDKCETAHIDHKKKDMVVKIWGSESVVGSIWASRNLRQVFSTLCWTGGDSLMDKVVELGLFAFGSEHTYEGYNEITQYRPHEQDRACIYVREAQKIIFDAIIETIQLMVGNCLIVNCDKCMEKNKIAFNARIYPDQFFRHDIQADTCEACEDMGLLLTDKVKVVQRMGFGVGLDGGRVINIPQETPITGQR